MINIEPIFDRHCLSCMNKAALEIQAGVKPERHYVSLALCNSCCKQLSEKLLSEQKQG